MPTSSRLTAVLQGNVQNSERCERCASGERPQAHTFGPSIDNFEPSNRSAEDLCGRANGVG